MFHQLGVLCAFAYMACYAAIGIQLIKDRRELAGDVPEFFSVNPLETVKAVGFLYSERSFRLFPLRTVIARIGLPAAFAFMIFHQATSGMLANRF